MARVIIAVNKLIRDKIPEILEQDSITASFKPLDDAAYFTALKTKLMEEAA